MLDFYKQLWPNLPPYKITESFRSMLAVEVYTEVQFQKCLIFWWMERHGWVDWEKVWSMCCRQGYSQRALQTVSLCVKTSSAFWHVTNLSVNFTLLMGCWDRQEVRKCHEWEPGDVGGLLEMEEGEMLCWASRLFFMSTHRDPCLQSSK